MLVLGKSHRVEKEASQRMCCRSRRERGGSAASWWCCDRVALLGKCARESARTREGLDCFLTATLVVALGKRARVWCGDYVT